MVSKHCKQILLIILCLLTAAAALQAQDKGTHGTNRLYKTNGKPHYTKLNINNISTYVYDNGNSDMGLNAYSAGFTYPKGSGKTAVYASGLQWGAKVNGKISAGGSFYLQGLQPGKIISTGKPADPEDPSGRIFRVRPDYKTASLCNETGDEGLSEDAIRAQYAKDWLEWPAQDGAPYNDKDCNGKYDPNIDIPGVPGAAQTVWFAANDLNPFVTDTAYGCAPMGIEMQASIWAYNKPGELNNTIFRKYLIINKGTVPLTDMYLSMWFDPDLGNAMDDFAGCDTNLSLGYAYNAYDIDDIYGSMAPPAVGIDYLQRPVVPASSSDSAVFNGKIIKGKKNLPMTAFYYYLYDVLPTEDPSLDPYVRTLRMYNYMQGRLGRTGEPYTIPMELGGGITKFPLSGDPVKGTGYVDGIVEKASDRRIGISSGPFTMAVGDTQEVVIAEIAAMGTDRLNSVELLKNYDKKVQQLYDNFFSPVAEPSLLARPNSPKVKSFYNEQGITVSWDRDDLIEKFDKNGFKFQGYNVYQLDPELYPENSVRIATFDLADGITAIMGQGIDPNTGKPGIIKQQFGTDSGIERSVTIKRDSLTHDLFSPGKKYYFEVTAYTYRPDPAFYLTNSESLPGRAEVIYNDTIPGLKLNDTLSVVRLSGRSDQVIKPLIIDPAKLTGHEYQAGFETVPDSLTWYLKDVTADKIILSHQPIRTGTTISSMHPVIDGMRLIVKDIKPGMKGYSVPAGKLNWSPLFAQGRNLEGFEGAIGRGYGSWLSSSSVEPHMLENTLIKFAATDASGNLKDPNDPNVSFAYRYLRNAWSAPARPGFEQYIKNTSSHFACQDYIKNFPFAAYKVSTGERLMVGYSENNAALGTVDGKYWPPSSSDSIDNNYAAREWFFIFDKPYSETPDPALQKDIELNKLPLMWFGTVTRKDNAAFDSNDQFLIIRNNSFTADDKFSFKTAYQPPVNNKIIPKEYVLMQNFPNPFNPATTISYLLKSRTNVELKVYDILGREVMTLVDREQNAGEYKVNFNASLLSSGIYIYRIRAGEFIKSCKMVLVK